MIQSRVGSWLTFALLASCGLLLIVVNWDLAYSLIPVSRVDECLCGETNENFCFNGLDEKGATIRGRRFENCLWLYKGLRSRGLLDKDAVQTRLVIDDIDDIANWMPVIVTATSSNHFDEMRMMVSSLAQTYDNYLLIIYDLGLNSKQKTELLAWCNVELRKFNFDDYPRHVRQLKTYAFKLCIIDALQTHKMFAFVDSSIRFTNTSLHRFVEAVKRGELQPHSTHTSTVHSVLATTHPTMLTYLPIPPMITRLVEVQATFQFIVDSVYTRQILKWWFLCASTSECIAPKGSTARCDIRGHSDLTFTYIGCHRYDQAFWNLYSLSHLFGEQRGALQLGYVQTDWNELDATIVDRVDAARNKTIAKFWRHVTIRRGDALNKPLVIPCKRRSQSNKSLAAFVDLTV